MTVPEDRRFDPATDNDLLADADRTDTGPGAANTERMENGRTDASVGLGTAETDPDLRTTDDNPLATTDGDAGLRNDDALAAKDGDAGLRRTDDATRVSTDAGTGIGATGDRTGPEPLVAEDAAVDLRARWDVIQQGFVDDPRNAVTEADHLVDDLLTRLSETFDQQHRDLENQWSDGEPSTEDLRTALQRYRAFFQRLLTI